MSSVTQVTAAIQTMLTTGAERAARDSNCVRRQRRFTGPLWVQTLVLGCLQHPDTTLSHLAQMAATLGVPVSPQAIAQRFTPATADCLRQVLEQAVQQRIGAQAGAAPVLERFTEVVVLDTTTIALPAALATAWPGCGNGSAPSAAALKAGVRLDLRRGTLTGPLVESGRTHDRCCAVTKEPVPPGALRIADLGFWSVPELAKLGADGGFWVSRLQAQTGVLTPTGTAFDLDQCLATTPESMLELAVQLGKTQGLPARLLAVRVPPEVAEERRRRIRADAKRRGHTPRQARLHRADWLLLVTNVPAERLSVAEALVLLRARWQIELLFKQWKQGGRIDVARSANPYRMLAEVFAKLIGMVLQHWTVVLGCWHRPHRSYAKAAHLVRTLAVTIALALPNRRALRSALEQMLNAIAHSGDQNPRQAHPNLGQLLLALKERA
jgi:hypothetical protein